MFIDIGRLGSIDGMQINVISHEPHTISLRPFKLILCPIASLIFTAAKLFPHSDIREALSFNRFASLMAVVLKL